MKSNKTNVKELNSKIIDDKEKDFIKMYVKPPQVPLTIDKINSKLNENLR